MWFVWLLAACSGCATTSASCPSGTKALTVPVDTGRAELCATTEPARADMPLEGRSFDKSLGAAHPAAFTGGVDGPFTSYYESGALASHGRYVDLGGRSVPQGLWVFWRPNGKRWVYGIYHQGTPVGCFAQFDENGGFNTGVVKGDELHLQPCTPPPDDEIAVLEGLRPVPEPPAWADVSLEGLVGPNHLAVTNSDQSEPDPATTSAFTLSARYRYDRLRIGPWLGYRWADDLPDSAFSAGGTVAVELPTFHPRVHPELGGLLGVERTTLKPERPGMIGRDDLAFWWMVAGLRAGAGVELSPIIELVVAFRLDAVPSYSTERTTIYCDQRCTPPVMETWNIGVFNYGLDVGLRFSIR